MVIPKVMPVNMNSVARVTTKELSCSRVMMKPLKAPMATPKARATSTPAHGGHFSTCMQKPPAIVASPPMAPSDRFIPPTMMAIACPRATNT